jgi:drug/metabolite transporter (DMT)-like permease
MSHGMSQETDGSDRPHKAGAYDVRNVIAALIGFYGIVLVLVAVFGEDEPEKTGGVDANLWAGLAMLVFAAAFGLWSRLRPVVVDPGADISGESAPRGH